MAITSQDVLTVAGVPSVAFIRLDLLLEGTLNVSLDPTTSWNSGIGYQLRSAGNAIYVYSLSCDTITQRAGCAVGAGGITQVLVPYAGPTPLTQSLAFGFSCTADSSSADCLQSGNFYDTAALGGAVALDSQMNVLSGATITSQSGHDYTLPLATGAAIPESGTLPLVIAGGSLTALCLSFPKLVDACSCVALRSWPAIQESSSCAASKEPLSSDGRQSVDALVGRV